MSIISFLKLFFNKSQSNTISPKMAVTPMETISFPSDYTILNSHNTIPIQTTFISGTDFGSSILTVPASQQRDDIIYRCCLTGNLPAWMRQFKPITVSDSQNNQLTYFVSPDVLCIGTDDDFLRVSLNGYTARRVVDLFGCMLPTSKMSDDIWRNADLQMTPTGMGASAQMTTTKILIDHNNVIEKERAGQNFNIIAGHKKDIVYTPHLNVDKTRIAIYGWHQKNGIPIQGPQPNATSHNVLYQDYSHSVRLISQKALLNQQEVNLYNVLNDANYAHLISREGIVDARSMYIK